MIHYQCIMFSQRIKPHQHFSINKIGTDFFVGDIHGHYQLLLDSLSRAGFNEHNGDRVFLVGDIINRGPNSAECIELLLKKYIHSALGNHDEMMLCLLDDPSIINQLKKVGGEWLLDYDAEPRKLKFLVAVLLSKINFAMTVETRLGTIGVTHAEAPDDWQQIRNKSLTDKEKSLCVWSLEKYHRPLELSESVQNIDLVVHGHTNSEKVICKKNQIWIDTLRETKKLTVLTAEQLFSFLETDHA